MIAPGPRAGTQPSGILAPMIATVRTRFAPSPTGLLHLGNARTALFAWLAARGAGPDGRCVLRIEDTDAARNQAEAIRALLGDLAWLGLDWDEGPEQGGPHAPYLQSARAARHAAAFDRLIAGGHAYPCFCTDADLERSRAALRAGGRPPRYAGTCRGLSADAVAERRAAGLAESLRFAVPARRTVRFDDAVHGPQRQASRDIGDFVVRRRDGTPTFLFANAVDDAEMGITLALRGEDHLANTPRQVLILEALGLAAPRYGHLPLVLGAEGGPLSKRDGATSLADLRTAGYLPAAVVNYLARLGHSGYPDGSLSLAELAAGFRLDHLGRAPAHLDEVQLLHFQKLALQQLDTQAVLAWADIRDLAPVDPDAFVACVRGNISLPADLRAWADRLRGRETGWDAAAQAEIAAAPRALFVAALSAAEASDFAAVVAAVRAATAARGPSLFKPLRAALTGALSGPELAAWWPLLPVARRHQLLGLARDSAH